MKQFIHKLPDCVAGDHEWEEIYIDRRNHSDNVVRWCSDCGAIVIDVDFDGRTNPGQVMPIRGPKLQGFILEQ